MHCTAKKWNCLLTICCATVFYALAVGKPVGNSREMSYDNWIAERWSYMHAVKGITKRSVNSTGHIGLPLNHLLVQTAYATCLPYNSQGIRYNLTGKVNSICFMFCRQTRTNGYTTWCRGFFRQHSLFLVPRWRRSSTGNSLVSQQVRKQLKSHSVSFRDESSERPIVSIDPIHSRLQAYIIYTGRKFEKIALLIVN